MSFAQATVNPSSDWRYIANNAFAIPGGTVGATLDAILSATPANMTIMVSDTQTLTTNRTVPATCTLIVVKPGYIVIPSGATLTISGSFQAGDYKVFQCADATALVAGLTYGKLRWWGATGNGTTEDTAFIQSAIDCVFKNNTQGGVLEGTPNDVYSVEPVTISLQGDFKRIFDGKGAKLKQKTTANVLNIGNALAGSGYLNITNWNIRGAATGTDGYGIYIDGKGANSLSGIGNVAITNCDIRYFDTGLYMYQGIYCLVDTCTISYCDTHIYGKYSAIANACWNNVNEFRNLRMTTSIINSIYFEYASTVKFDHVSIEGSAGRLITLKNCNSFQFNNLHIEGNGTDNVATEGFVFDNCAGVSIRDSHLALGGGSALTSHIKMINGTRGVCIDGGYLYCSAMPIFADDGTSAGCSVKNVYFGSQAGWAGSLVSYYMNNNYPETTGGTIITPLEGVKRLDGRVSINYANAMSVSNPSAVNNCDAAVDTAAYGTTDTIKFTATGATPTYKCGLTGDTPPTGTYWGVYSVIVKTDTAQTFAMSTPIGNGTITIPGDSKWRQVALVVSVTNPGKFYTKYTGAVGTTTGNVWYAAPEYRMFATYAEACQWIGAVSY